MAAPLFELVVYKHFSSYDGALVAGGKEAVAAFVAMCCKYVAPCEVPQEQAVFQARTLVMTYKDLSGNDKPKMVMLMGPLTEEMKAEAQAALAAMYTQECSWYIKGGGTCKTVVPLGSGVCKSCHEVMHAKQ